MSETRVVPNCPHCGLTIGLGYGGAPQCQQAWGGSAESHANYLKSLTGCVLKFGSNTSAAAPQSEPAAYAIRNDQGYWVGIWNTREQAEAVLAKGLASNKEEIVSLYHHQFYEKNPQKVINAAATQEKSWVDMNAEEFRIAAGQDEGKPRVIDPNLRLETPASAAPASTEYCWLIERGQSEGQDPPIWLKSMKARREFAPFKDTWTYDARQAMKYHSRDLAGSDARETGLCRVVEHGFITPTSMLPLSEKWKVFCAVCKDTWDVPCQHPWKSICADCEKKAMLTLDLSRQVAEKDAEIVKMRDAGKRLIDAMEAELAELKARKS